MFAMCVKMQMRENKQIYITYPGLDDGYESGGRE